MAQEDLTKAGKLKKAMKKFKQADAQYMVIKGKVIYNKNITIAEAVESEKLHKALEELTNINKEIIKILTDK